MIRPEPTPPYNPSYTADHRNWISGIAARDHATAWSQATDPGSSTPVYILRDTTTGTTITEIKPRPQVKSIGTKSRPFRLLRGQEIQISEDDLRISGISKRYLPNQVGGYGCYYQIGDPVGGEVQLFDIVLFQVDDPLTYSVTVRRREFNRERGFDYDLP